MSCKNIEYQYSKSLARRQKRRAEASLVFVFIFLSMYVFNVLVGFFKRGWFIADVFAIVSFFSYTSYWSYYMYIHILNKEYFESPLKLFENIAYIFFYREKALTVIVHRIFKFIMFLGVINFKFSDLLKWKIRSLWLSNSSFCNELPLINILKMIEVTSILKRNFNVRCKVNWKTCLTWKNKFRINISVKFD